MTSVLFYFFYNLLWQKNGGLETSHGIVKENNFLWPQQTSKWTAFLCVQNSVTKVCINEEK